MPAQRIPDPLPPTSGMIRRIRRRADLSQRDLAAALGVGQATVARWEVGATAPSTDHLASAARLAGLRVALVDDTGAEAAPMRADAVTDRAGRYYPAHLDPVGSGWWTPWSSLDAAYTAARDRARRVGDVSVGYHQRLWRSRRRWVEPSPQDHPRRAEVVAAVRKGERRAAETRPGRSLREG